MSALKFSSEKKSNQILESFLSENRRKHSDERLPRSRGPTPTTATSTPEYGNREQGFDLYSDLLALEDTNARARSNVSGANSAHDVPEAGPLYENTGAGVRSTSSPALSTPPPTPPPRTRKPESPRFDRLEVNALTEVNGVKPTVEIDSMVEVRVADVSFFGVVRWLGSLLDQDMKVAGIELVGIELRNLVPARLTVWFFLFTGG